MKQSIFVYLLAAMCLSANAQQTQAVWFASGPVDFPANFKQINNGDAFRNEELFGGFYARYVQCLPLPDAQALRAMEAEGVQFIGYVYAGAYLCLIPASFDPKHFDKINARSIMPVMADWKTARNVREQPWPSWAVKGDQIELIVQVYPALDLDLATSLLEKERCTVLTSGMQSHSIRLLTSPERLAQLADLPYVRYIELAPEPGAPEDERSRSLHRSSSLDVAYGGGLQLTGKNVNVLVRDDGAVGPHIDFKNRLQNVTAGFGSGHGDWVSGVLASAGNLNPFGRGMARGANVFTLDYDASFEDNTIDLHLNNQVTLSNTSYSDGCNSGYSTFSQTVDRQMFNNPTLLHVFSSGNRGTNNCNYGAGANWGNITGGHKMAKNSLAVGNLLEDNTLNDGSSRGPATDGRLKPEVCAHGTDVFMTQEGNAYSFATGTSFSSPATVGCLAQLSEAFAIANNGQTAPAALLKAVVMNSAQDLGKPGPDFKFGYGSVHAQRAYQCIQGNQWLFGATQQGETQSYTIQTPANVKEMRVMVYWNDQPAELSAAKDLVHDLDLTVLTPAGESFLPWVLDPTPNVLNLDAPATRRRDSLNNVEQVSIIDPAAGEYTIQVKGFDIPFQGQFYYVVWTFIFDEIELVYPVGGESMIPGQSERIHWDAPGNTDNFQLRLSNDDGQSWQTINGNIPASLRTYVWTPTPAQVGGKWRMSISRGTQEDVTEQAFSIAPVRENIEIVKVCPDSATLSWALPPADTLMTEVMMLGSLYMEPIALSAGASVTFPFANDGAEHWFTVRTRNDFGLVGQRALALRWTGGLFNCTQNYDLAAKAVLMPVSDRISSCSPVSDIVAARFENEGLSALSNVSVSYQLGNGPVVTESVADIQAGGTLEHTFQTPVVFDQSGLIRLRIWCDAAGETARFNDTIVQPIQVTIGAINAYFTEQLEAPNLPSGWYISNPDADITWDFFKSTALVDADGQSSQVIAINCFNYSDQGQKDFIYLKPIDLNGLANPTFLFDVAYAPYSTGNFFDTLRVEVFENCDINSTPVVIWEKGGAELATAPPINTTFTPLAITDWRGEAVSLDSFGNQFIVMRITCVNDWGNRMFLDNIALQDITPVQADASFAASADSICRLDTVLYQAQTLNTDGVDFEWTFGSQAQPVSAVGPGPHAVRYLTIGNKAVRLIATSPFNADTSDFNLYVRPFPTSNFISSATDLTVTFTNTSLNATSYLWDFGDGQSSVEQNPVHTYGSSGNYSVKLSAINECRTVDKTNTVMLTSAVGEPGSLQSLTVNPNPSEGVFTLTIQLSEPMQDAFLQVNDAAGRIVFRQAVNLPTGQTRLPVNIGHLPKGMYQLQLLHVDGVANRTVSIQ